MNSSMRIVFFGTPDFAVPSLDILIKNNFNVVAVVTAADKPSGRGQKIKFSAIKEYALKQGIPVLQPLLLKDESFLTALKELSPDLQIVVAFRMLPDQVWELPTKGTFNLHGSLLPQYRGAAPINWAIINGESETGVSTFFLQHAIDTGDIILQKSASIGSDETAGELHDRLMMLGADLVLETVKSIQNGSVKTQVQQENKFAVLKSASKLNKENTRLTNKAVYSDAYNLIRGLSPYPAAYTELYHKESGVSLAIKLFKAKAVSLEHHKVPGTIETDNKTYLRVYFLKGYLDLIEVQISGRTRMNVKDLLNGFKFEGDWNIGKS